MITIRTKQAFKDANLNRFKSIADSDEAKGLGLFNALTKAGFYIQTVGKTTHASKGRAIISFKGSPNSAFVTLIKPC